MPSAPKPCNRNCGTLVHWPVAYNDGDKILNPDNTEHSCTNGQSNYAGQTQAQLPQQQQQQQSQPQQPPAPAITPTSVLGEIATFVAAHAEKLTDAKFETVGKIYISRMMSRR